MAVACLLAVKLDGALRASRVDGIAMDGTATVAMLEYACWWSLGGFRSRVSADGGVGSVSEIACPDCDVFAFRPGQYRPCCPAEGSREGNKAEDRRLGNGTSSGGVKGGKQIRLLAPNPARSPYFGAASKLTVKFSRAAVVERK